MNKTPRILIVDDEPFNVVYLEQELEELNYETLSAANGQEALEKIRTESPDLVLLDIMMPLIDGFGVLEKVKADPSTRNIPIIVISASNDLQNIVRGIESGAEDFLPKPFEPTILKARISSSLEKKQLRDREQLYLQGLERELDIAREIQKEFLPSELPQITGWEIAAYFKAAREVAGDFYDAFTLPDGSLAFVIADVCGKGVGAALYMTLFRSLIHATLLDQFDHSDGTTEMSPARFLMRAVTHTNKYVAETHEAANMFATIFIGILKPATGVVFYINGGNEPPVVISVDGKIRCDLPPTGPAIGVMPETKFEVKEITLAPGDALVAFTDGIPDNKNVRDEFFGRERLLRSLQARAGSVADLFQKIQAELTEFSAGDDQFDDITLMAVKRA
jgi:sigma-B regulation protein RsbU (phosphoserine phosphatase)